MKFDKKLMVMQWDSILGWVSSAASSLPVFILAVLFGVRPRPDGRTFGWPKVGGGRTSQAGVKIMRFLKERSEFDWVLQLPGMELDIVMI